jgi:hypothetical protein
MRKDSGLKSNAFKDSPKKVAKPPRERILKGSGLKSALRQTIFGSAREQNFLLIQTGDAFEAGEQTPEGAAEEE